MPDEARLHRTRAHDTIAPCGHPSQMLDTFRLVTLPDGTSARERIPQRFRVRGPNARYCLDCGQFVDDWDEVKSDA